MASSLPKFRIAAAKIEPSPNTASRASPNPAKMRKANANSTKPATTMKSEGRRLKPSQVRASSSGKVHYG